MFFYCKEKLAVMNWRIEVLNEETKQTRRDEYYNRFIGHNCAYNLIELFNKAPPRFCLRTDMVCFCEISVFVESLTIVEIWQEV